jgi:uncharacterized membrane protein
MNKKLIPVLVLVLATAFLAADAAAKVKFLSLTEFGISVKANNLYAAKGNTAAGTVIDATKARLAAGMTDARRGQRVTATYVGNGFVEVENASTGARVTIEIKEHVP